jgi:hypothetical protein
MPLRVTLDTNTIDHRARIESACTGLDVELAYTSVTDRETEGTARATQGAGVVETMIWGESRWGLSVWGGTVRESLVLGESRLGEAVLGSDGGASTFEAILDVIGSGSFPPLGSRNTMTAGQWHQLRDAMILEAHAREGRDVLVTQDVRGFIHNGRRERLETLCRTRILTVDEFCADVAALASRRSAWG